MAEDLNDFLRKIDALPLPPMKRRLARDELVSAWAVASAVVALIAWTRSLLAPRSVTPTAVSEAAPQDDAQTHPAPSAESRAQAPVTRATPKRAAVRSLP